MTSPSHHPVRDKPANAAQWRAYAMSTWAFMGSAAVNFAWIAGTNEDEGRWPLALVVSVLLGLGLQSARQRPTMQWIGAGIGIGAVAAYLALGFILAAALS